MDSIGLLISGLSSSQARRARASLLNTRLTSPRCAISRSLFLLNRRATAQAQRICLAVRFPFTLSTFPPWLHRECSSGGWPLQSRRLPAVPVARSSSSATLRDSARCAFGSEGPSCHLSLLFEFASPLSLSLFSISLSLSSPSFFAHSYCLSTV